MPVKKLIIAVIAAGGILFGTWNWLNYFKDQAQAPAAEIKAVRPPAREQPAPAQAAAPVNAQVPANAQAPAADSPATPEQGLVVSLPDTVGRNPFLTPDEIAAIARGEILTESKPPPRPINLSDLPGHKLDGIIRNTREGGYKAIMNGKAYASGDTIGIEEIVEITPETVVLEFGGNRRTLSLESGKENSGVSIKFKKLN